METTLGVGVELLGVLSCLVGFGGGVDRGREEEGNEIISYEH
jgi:hypothetical protein